MMRAPRSSTLLLLGLSMLSACQRSKREEEVRYDAAPATLPAPPALTASEVSTSQHLDAAHESFATKNLDDAASEIRSAVERLRRDAERAPREARKEMREAADGLEHVERDIRSGSQNSLETMDHALAKANASLARFHAMRATDSWVAAKQSIAGREIASAVAEIEIATRRLGHDLSSQEVTFARHAESVGHKLMDGTRVADRDVGLILKGLDREIDELFRDLRKQ